MLWTVGSHGRLLGGEMTAGPYESKTCPIWSIAGCPLSTLGTSVEGAGANASCVQASFCAMTQPTRVLQCAKWLHAPDLCCTCRPVGVLGSGRCGRCMRVVCGHVCQCVHAGPWGLIACVCTPGRVRVRVPHPQACPVRVCELPC